MLTYDSSIGNGVTDDTVSQPSLRELHLDELTNATRLPSTPQLVPEGAVAKDVPLLLLHPPLCISR